MNYSSSMTKFIQLFIRNVIQKVDIKYHMAPNIIFSVVFSSLKVKSRIVIEMSRKSIGIICKPNLNNSDVHFSCG